MAKYGPIYCNWSGYQKVADPFRVLELAHQAGASCMEWHLDNLDHFSDDELAEFRRRSEEYGIEHTFAASGSREYSPQDPDPVRRRKYAESFADVFKRIQLLGAHYSNSELATQDWRVPPAQMYFDRDRAFELAADSAKQICRIARDFDITPCSEVSNRYERWLLNDSYDAKKLAEMVDEPNFKYVLDVFHSNIEEESWIGCFERMGKYIGYMHLGESNRKYPGTVKDSKMDWRTIFTQLHKYNFDGLFIFEAFVKDQCEWGYWCNVWKDYSGGADEAATTELNRKAIEFARHMYEVETAQ